MSLGSLVLATGGWWTVGHVERFEPRPPGHSVCCTFQGARHCAGQWPQPQPQPIPSAQLAVAFMVPSSPLPTSLRHHHTLLLHHAPAASLHDLGLVTQCNAKVLQMFGYGKAELMGRSVHGPSQAA
jgi:hypothetical protein